MRVLSTHAILKAWETGQNQHPLDRALTILALALPEETKEKLASYSVACRDGLLLDLRRRMFGPALRAAAECPCCNELLEFTLSVDDIQGTDAIQEEKPLEAAAGDWDLRFRMPNSMDLAMIVGCGNTETATRELAARCVVEADRNGESVESTALPEEVVTALEARLEEAGPPAEVLVDLICPACGRGSQMIFDVVSFLWEELQAQARRLLLEVHTLASAYGWRERDILSLAPSRRQFYLDMVT